MEAGNFISHQTIQEALFRRTFSLNKYIYHPLEINRNTTSLEDLLHIIYDDLESMHFDIIKTDNLFNEDGQSIPGYTGLRTDDRKDGGVVKLNKNYPDSLILEALFHEYVHIKDETIPILPMDESAANFVALHYKPFLKNIEFQVNVMANSLMMPPEIMWTDLLELAYNIDSILLIYKDFNICSVLRWISIIDRRFPSHFVCLWLDKNEKNKILRTFVEDSYTYDHVSDPRPFNIYEVINNQDSAAATIFNIKIPRLNKASTINGIDYYCYAYYELDLIREVVKENTPGKQIIKYDRLLVIGWKKLDIWPIQMYRV